MKFAEIKKVLEEKLKIQENTKKEIEFRIEKLQNDLDDIKCDMDNIQGMINTFDDLSTLAE